MKKAHKKRPPHATTNSPPGLSDMEGIYFINLVNLLNFYYYKYTLFETLSHSYE